MWHPQVPMGSSFVSDEDCYVGLLFGVPFPEKPTWSPSAEASWEGRSRFRGSTAWFQPAHLMTLMTSHILLESFFPVFDLWLLECYHLKLKAVFFRIVFWCRNTPLTDCRSGGMKYHIYLHSHLPKMFNRSWARELFLQFIYHRIGWWENLQERLIFDGKNHGFL